MREEEEREKGRKGERENRQFSLSPLPPCSLSSAACHLCGKAAVEFFPEFAGFHRVTSDSCPWPSGGRLGVCRACNTVQKAIDAVWQAESRRSIPSIPFIIKAAGSSPPCSRKNRANPRHDRCGLSKVCRVCLFCKQAAACSTWVAAMALSPAPFAQVSRVVARGQRVERQEPFGHRGDSARRRHACLQSARRSRAVRPHRDDPRD